MSSDSSSICANVITKLLIQTNRVNHFGSDVEEAAVGFPIFLCCE